MKCLCHSAGQKNSVLCPQAREEALALGALGQKNISL